MPLVGCAETATIGDQPAFSHPRLLADTLLERLSSAVILNVGDRIGDVRQARFIYGGERIVVLDRYPPHLHLFHNDGRHIWTGGRYGAGPGEHQGPQSLEIVGDDAVVLQRGKAIFWRITPDSLVPRDVRTEASFHPYDMAQGCDDRLLVYGVEGARFFEPNSDIAVLFELEGLEDNEGRFVVRWKDTAQPGRHIVSGHTGPLVGGHPTGWIVRHRQNWDINGPGGDVLEVS
jgi:hypothetical protein